ncbi:hypothetical protein MD588_03835 [Photobacterium sp. SDRW27]|uniref:hypothetical protein n=1 Tax=Photobacterium obscurum TaxID=2829490 RepID=UPI002243F914|nr:hypothetical protein [Photobacterium obscurum]MCW8327930.1 hypothetical protein [Photobacterium obscurum]
MKSNLELMRVIFNCCLLGCVFVIILSFFGVVDLSDIWFPIQNYFRGELAQVDV